MGNEIFYSAPGNSLFMGFQAINTCQCPNEVCAPTYAMYGYTPGCQQVGPTSKDSSVQYVGGVWYSFPGACISQQCALRTPACLANEPGGRCEAPTGSRHCTWQVERAGQVNLSDLVLHGVRRSNGQR